MGNLFLDSNLNNGNSSELSRFFFFSDKNETFFCSSFLLARCTDEKPGVSLARDGAHSGRGKNSTSDEGFLLNHTSFVWDEKVIRSARLGCPNIL